MLMIKGLAMVFLLITNVVDMPACQKVRKQDSTKSSTPSPTTESMQNKKNEIIKVLAEGGYSKVEEPFIVVARDNETYAALRKMVDKLPDMNDEFFKGNAVVGAFLGRRPTGGYSVDITSSGEGEIKVSETTPPADAMVTQALTNPFKVVSIPARNGHLINVDAIGPWQSKAVSYEVKQGKNTCVGGIAGQTIERDVDGNIRVMHYKDLVTLFFALRSYAENERVAVVNDASTGIVQSDGQIKIGRFNGGLQAEPTTTLKASGTIKDSEISLIFVSLPSYISDGFHCSGQIKANK
jgi:hypothetical protein